MIALVEQEDGSYKSEERGDPKCGEDFCDSCGDCLHCYPWYEGYCLHSWVIYKDV